METILKRAMTIAFMVGVLSTTTSAWSQSSRPQAMPDTPEPVKVGNLEFRIRSAVLSGGGGAFDTVRLTFSAHNSADSSVSMYFVGVDTSVALDSGDTFSGAKSGPGAYTAAGAIICPNGNRESCNNEKSRFITAIPASSTDNIILTFSIMVNPEAIGALKKVENFDFATVVYIATDRESGFIPLTFPGVKIRNMLN